MSAPGPSSRPASVDFTARLLQVILVVLLMVSSVHVLSSFIGPVVWASIIAVSLHPIHRWIESRLRGRATLAATMTTLLALVLLSVPAVYLGDTLVGTAQQLAQRIHSQGVQIPPLPAVVAGLPVIGAPLDQFWTQVSQDNGAVADELKQHLKPIGGWILAIAEGVAAALATFVIATLIGGVILAHSRELLASVQKIGRRIAPHRGAALTKLAEDTIRNVTRGVLGVAVIQALCAGAAFALVGIPGAGLLALLCLVLAIVQVGVLPVLAPVALYALFSMDLVVAVPFTLWCGFVGMIDNVLKPLMLHHGLRTPLWVIVLGSIGGMLSSGFIGLFIGPVVLVLTYELGRAWLDGDDADGTPATLDERA